MEDKRLIEVDFPLKEVSEGSVREKNLRHGHISTLQLASLAKRGFKREKTGG